VTDPPRPARRSRQRLGCALGALLGAGLLVAVAGRPWVTQVVPDVPGVTRVSASGGGAAPAAPALALVAAAGAAALLVTGRVGRRLAAVVLVLAGLGAGAAVVTVLAAPGDAIASAVAAATGRSGRLAGPAAAVTGWVWPALAAAALVAACGAVAVVRAPAWPAPGRRFDTPAAASAPPAGAGGTVRGQGDAIGAWDALSRGEDPTG
jgi:uncharacterized membrane protein (TIGR02234 family)